MPLLIEKGLPVADTWTRLPDDAAAATMAGVAVIVPLDRLLGEPDTWRAWTAGLGVSLRSDQHPAPLAPWVDRLGLVVVDFPKFRDGRGFTVARQLREQLAYAGPIRASGHTLPDQYLFLVRCGVTQVEIPDGRDPGAWHQALEEFDIAYQPAVATAPGLSRLARLAASSPTPLTATVEYPA